MSVLLFSSHAVLPYLHCRLSSIKMLHEIVSSPDLADYGSRGISCQREDRETLVSMSSFSALLLIPYVLRDDIAWRRVEKADMT